MPNTIRTPRRGTSASAGKIADAVDDQTWQEFRVSMKGKSTEEKLGMLKRYYKENDGDRKEVIQIRVDNYIKALCRGGQLYAGESLQTALKNSWWLEIKR